MMLRENSSAGQFPSFWITSGSTGATIDLSISGTLTADHENVRQQGENTSEETGDEDVTTRTGSSGFEPTSDGFFWTITTAKYETDGDNSLDGSGEFDTGDGEKDGDGGAEVTSKDKVTTDKWVFTVETESDDLYTFHRHKESTITNKVGEGKATASRLGVSLRCLRQSARWQYRFHHAPLLGRAD